MTRTSFIPRLLPALAALALLDCEAGTMTDAGSGTLSLLAVSGNNQSGVVGAQLARPLVVKVVNPANKPVKGQIVNFRVTAGGGSVFAGAALTNAQGLAQELWTLGTVAGAPQTVEARAVDPGTGAPVVFATFTATAVAGAPATVDVNPDSVGLAPGATAQLTATAADQYGNPIAIPAFSWAPRPSSPPRPSRRRRRPSRP